MFGKTSRSTQPTGLGASRGTLSAWAFAVALFGLSTGEARAQLALSAGLEYFSWSEDTEPIRVRERGPQFALGLAFTQPKPQALLFAYRGRFYVGKVHYDGAALDQPSLPVTGVTGYLGTAQESQARYSIGHGIDVLGGLGFDFWRRKLGDTQKEDYRIVYVRFGVESKPASPGCLFGAGLTYPLWTREDAHLTDTGFDRNADLEPGRDIGFFGKVGYRFEPHWAIFGYLNATRFTQSRSVPVSSGGLPQGVVFQPGIAMYIFGLELERSF